MPVTLYDDLAKAASDLLKDDFQFARKTKVTSTTANGVKFTSETVMSGEGSSRSVLSKLAAKYSHSSGLTLDKLQVTTHGRVVGEASLDGVADGLTFTIKAEDGSANNSAGKKYEPYGKLGAEFANDRFSATAELDVVNGPTLSATAVAAHEAFRVGAEATVNTHFDDDGVAPELEGYDVAASYAGDDFTATVQSGNSLGSWTASFNHNAAADTKVAAQLSYNTQSEAMKLAVVGRRQLDGATSVKAKLDKDGVVSLAYTQKMNKTTTLSTAAQIDALNFSGDSHKFGLAVTFSA